jgi:hypothetical protein
MNENRTSSRGLLRRQLLETAVALGGSRLVPAPMIVAAASAAAQSAQPGPVGASNLVGWMVTYNGSAQGPYLGARLYSSAGFAPRPQLDALVAQQPLRHLRFSPNGGWVIICGVEPPQPSGLPAPQQNTLAFSQDVGGPAFPQDAHDLLQNVAAAGNTVLDIFLSPTNDFVIKALLSDGTRQYLPSQHFNVEILDIIQEFDPPSGSPAPASGRAELLCLVFPPPPPLPAPSPQGLQSTVWTSCIVLCDNNNFQTLNNPPQDVVNQLAAIKTSANGSTYPVADKATNIVYTSATGWIVTTAKDLRYPSASFDSALWNFINQLDRDQHEAGYALSLSDIVVEVPVRNVSFRVQTIDVVTPRSGAFDNSDTLVGQIWIGLDQQLLPPVGAYFGNEVKAGTIFGLGGVQTSSRPQGGGLTPTGLPAALPLQYAMSVGPVQISNPRSSLTFGFMLVNNGSQNFPLVGSVQNLAKAAFGLVGTAVNALGSAIGVPGIGSITTGLISGLGSNAFPSGGCDGLCAMDTFNLSGGAVMALDYQAQNGLSLKQTSTYDNTVFPDSAFLSGQSPYDPNSNFPACQTSHYKVTTAIFESDSELVLPNPYGAPTSSGKTQVLTPSMLWPPGQTINGTDTTLQPLAACVFPPLNWMYLFWTANDTSNNIFYSSSADGVTWPGGQLVGGQPPVGKTAAALAACVYQSNQNNFGPQMFLFWVANNGSNRIYYGYTRDGNNWGAGGTINSTDSTPQTPAACVFQNKLFLFWTANDSGHFIYFSSYAGSLLSG